MVKKYCIFTPLPFADIIFFVIPKKYTSSHFEVIFEQTEFPKGRGIKRPLKIQKERILKKPKFAKSGARKISTMPKTKPVKERRQKNIDIISLAVHLNLLKRL